jgi:hypothetical protein
MPAHSRAVLEQMLPAAENRVARGAERIRAQEARVAALERRGLADQSKTLLAIMKQTQALQMEHVELLKRELAEPGFRHRDGTSAE